MYHLRFAPPSPVRVTAAEPLPSGLQLVLRPFGVAPPAVRFDFHPLHVPAHILHIMITALCVQALWLMPTWIWAHLDLGCYSI